MIRLAIKLNCENCRLEPRVERFKDTNVDFGAFRQGQRVKESKHVESPSNETGTVTETVTETETATKTEGFLCL